eukprot:3593242-Rhodomonas_salina.1
MACHDGMRDNTLVEGLMFRSEILFKPAPAPALSFWFASVSALQFRIGSWLRRCVSGVLGD